MADKQRVETEDLQVCADKYMQALESLKDSANTYKQALEALRSDWTGKAFAVMSTKVAAMMGNLERSYGKLTDAVGELKEVKTKFEESENQIKTTMSGLDSGSPFNV